MNTTEQLLRSIPNVDRLLHSPSISASDLPRSVVTDAVRRTLAHLRAQILDGIVSAVPEDDALCEAALRDAEADYNAGLRSVVNGTGVILHSNLGRSCLSLKAAEAVYNAAVGFSCLEYDLDKGRRGSRTAVLEAQLKKITGAEAAIVVNNNAAAVLLILSAIATGGDVIVSRGELVEIGGSFRVPEIMEQCGCNLREVGTTNKTRLDDYEDAIGGDVRALLKVHTSNFKIIGFTEDVSIQDLAALGQKYSLPVIEDIGSGALLRPEQFGLAGEPFARDSLATGADIVSFSGDKLLGGPQAGIILGKEIYLKKMKKHPLYRALRMDKLTIAALEATLRAYADAETAKQELPILRMLSSSPESLREKADILCGHLSARAITAEVTPVMSTVGSGSVPGLDLPSSAVALTALPFSADELDRRLRMLPKPIIGRIIKDRYVLDVRTIFDNELEYVGEAVAGACI